jgi:hypothetical protein
LPRYVRCCPILTGIALSLWCFSGSARCDEIRPATSTAHQLSPEALELIRGVVLFLLPPTFSDDDGWGDKARVQSGVNVRYDGGRLRTSRRWKSVNHGSWRQASGELVDPENTFQISAVRLADPREGTQRYEVRISTRLKVTGRQQQWNYGLRLWSISAEAAADVSLRVVFDVTSKVLKTHDGTRLRFQPNVTQAVATLDSFDLRRISHAKGSAVREFGDWLEKLIQRRVARENKELAARINKAIQKEPERLEIPFELGSWFLPSEHPPASSDDSSADAKTLTPADRS